MNNDQPIIACTHDGLFHSDEIMACALLKLAAGGSTVSIIRSRLAKDWERADFVIDVGGKYDDIKWFDHHQTESTGTRNDGTGYSSFGLLWKRYGATAVRELLLPYDMEDTLIADVVDDMENFVKGIDLHDQGELNISTRWSESRVVPVEILTLQNIISSKNCIPFIDKNDTATNNKKFYEALNLAEDILVSQIYRKASKVMANRYVLSRIKPNSNILFLEEFCDWHDVVSHHPEIMYVISLSSNGKAYAIQAVKIKGGANSIKNLRKPFPSTWAGLDRESLVKITGVSDALFCHRARFIASASTLEGALAMANKSIEYQ